MRASVNEETKEVSEAQDSWKELQKRAARPLWAVALSAILVIEIGVLSLFIAALPIGAMAAIVAGVILLDVIVASAMIYW